MTLPVLPDGARWVHAIGDDPRDCAGCVMDAVNAPDESMPPHDPEPAGMDPDNGEPWCACGHSLVAMRTDWLVLRIRHDQPTPPSGRFVEAIERAVVVAMRAAGITAVVDATTEPEARPERGRWYPDMPPALPGESDEAYTDRLTGADGTGRVPYDHRRYRQCSIGYHDECSQNRMPGDCACPCHEPRP